MAKGVRMGRRWRRPLPWIGRFACNHTVWREVLDTHPWATTWGSPYSGKFRTAVGETCGLPLRKGYSRTVRRKVYDGTHTRVSPVYSLRETRHQRNCVGAPTETEVT